MASFEHFKMNATYLFIATLLISALASITRGEIVFQDELVNELLAAGNSIAAGEDHGYAIARLRQAIQKHPQSPYVERVRTLANDLADSIIRTESRKRAGKTIVEAPAEFLTETRIPLHLVLYEQNRAALNRYVRWHPHDPAVLLLAQGRNCIDQLLPHLDNNSPTRVNDGFFRGGSDIPDVPRVSAVALSLIETVSGCRFLHPGGSQSLSRAELIEHIKQWWRENKDKSVADGIRAQIPHGDGYSMVTMAQNLIRIAGETSPPDREHGLQVIRKIARDPFYAGAAESLASYGDLSPVQWYHDQFKSWLNSPGRLWDHTIQAMFYLTEHGGRKEWELLCAIAARDKEDARQSRSGRHAVVLGSLANAKKAQTSPFAIPLLGMALADAEPTGSRWIDGQSFSKAEQATEYLQKQIGLDFGYRVDGSSQEQTAAIHRAQKWWADEGKSKYTFDYIENNLVKPAAK